MPEEIDMTRRPMGTLGAIIAVISSVFLAGCFGKSQSTRFYTLSVLPEAKIVSTAESPAGNAAIGIGPIQIADYLDQSKIVTRSSDNRLQPAEYDQWAGSFADNLTHVLADNIGFLVPTERIYLYPWRTSLPIDYQVVVDIVRCDGRLGEEVRLVARWQILSGEDRNVLAVKRSSIAEAVSGDDYDALVAAQSRALARLSGEIAAAIRMDGRQ
jgi:uncharacterized lipoprotein YmbA